MTEYKQPFECRNEDDIVLQVSDELFWGYQVTLNYQEYLKTPTPVLLHDLKQHMILFFRDHNLPGLADKVKKLQFTINRNMNHTNLIYVCTHSHD